MSNIYEYGGELKYIPHFLRKGHLILIGFICKKYGIVGVSEEEYSEEIFFDKENNRITVIARNYSDYFSIFEFSRKLCIYCSKHFKIWYDPDKFDWKNIDLLEKCCPEFKDIWEQDYLIRKII